jgi:hypothetical protein
MPKTVRVLVPTAPTAVARIERGPRPMRVGPVAFLHNGQPMYDPIAPVLLGALGDAGVAVTTWRKPRYSSPAEPEVLDAIAAATNAAIVGLAC